MPTGPEKYFLSQLQSHHCQLPPSDDFEYMKTVSRFKNFFLISEKSLQSYLKVKSLSAIFYEKRRQVRTTRALVVHPFSEFQKLWQLWMLFVFSVSIVLLPFFCAFHGPLYAKQLLANGQSLTTFYLVLALVILVQLACLAHVAVSFIHGYFIPTKDEIIIHPTGIAKRYLLTFFFPDLVSSIPIDAFLVLTRGIEVYSKLPRTEATLLSIIPLLKFFRLPTLHHYFANVFTRFHSPYAVYSVVVVIVSFYFLTIHWCACLFMLIPRWLYFQPLFSRSHSPHISNSLLHQYLYCYYVGLTTFISTGFDISEAKKVAHESLLIFLNVVGKIYRIIMLIMFLQLFSTLMGGQLRYIEMMDQVAEYMRMKRFPRALQKKVRINYTYLFGKEYIGEKGILQLVSDNLRREILLRMHENLIQKVLLFSGLGENLIFDFLTCLKPEIYLPDDVVYMVGDLGYCMYFISFGTVVVYAENKDEIGHLHDGDHFGEISLIFQLRRAFTVIALETTELYCLEAPDFLYVMKAYPTIYADMERQARERYAENRHSGYTHEGQDLNTKRTKDKGDEAEKPDDNPKHHPD